MNLINPIVSASHNIGIPSNMDSLTVLICYLIALVVAIYSINMLLKGALELAVELVLVTPVRIVNGIFHFARNMYSKSAKAIRMGIQERNRVVKKGQERAKKIDAEAKVAKAKHDAFVRSEKAKEKLVKTKTAIYGENVVKTKLKKSDEIDYSIPAYIRAGINIDNAFTEIKSTESIKVDENHTPDSVENVLSRQEKREKFLQEKNASKRLAQLNNHRFTSNGLIKI